MVFGRGTVSMTTPRATAGPNRRWQMPEWTKHILVFLLLALSACGDSRTEAPYEIMDEAPLFDTPESAALLEEFRSALPFDSIQLAYMQCTFGDCPQYTITVKRDGSASYSGSPNASREGQWVAEMGLFPFARLCEFIEQNRIVARLEADTFPAASDAENYQLRFWPSGQVSAAVFERERYRGPTDVWVLRSAIDGLIPRLEWTQVGNAND